METRTERGRRLVLCVIAASLTISVFTIVAFNLRRGTERLPQQVVRLLLTVGLCVLLYRGANWARWAAGILFAVAGLASLLGGFRVLLNGVAGLPLIAMGVVYVSSAAILLFVPAVRSHFGAGKAKAG